MASGWSYSGPLDEITGHCFLKVKRTVFNNNNQSTQSVISLWLSKALPQWAPSFPFHVCSFIRGMFPSSARKPREFAIVNWCWHYSFSIICSVDAVLISSYIYSLHHRIANWKGVCLKHYNMTIWILWTDKILTSYMYLHEMSQIKILVN